MGLQQRLLTHDKVPSWYSQGSYVRTGYRPVLPSVSHCFGSLGYLHNETVNIYSHLLPAVLALVGNYVLARYFSSDYPDASLTDRLVFHTYLTSCLLCFSISATYHTLMCHSETYASIWIRLDYLTICLQIFSSFLSGLYIGFYCESALRTRYWTMIGALSIFCGIIHVHPGLQNIQWRSLKLTVFVATGFSGLAPILHAVLLFPYQQFDKQAGLRYYYLEGVLFLSGVFFYLSRFPESKWPAHYDIWGASHQIFHVFVVLGSAAHFYGIMDAFNWNYHNPRCQR